MNCGYARTSILKQSAGIEDREQVSAVLASRPQFKAMMVALRLGDVVIVKKLDRLARLDG